MRRVLSECERRPDPAVARTIALLWRFAAEAARTEAAGFVRAAIDEAGAPNLPRNLDFIPANDDAGTSPEPRIRVRPSVGDEGPAPRVELSPDLIAGLDDAA